MFRPIQDDRERGGRTLRQKKPLAVGADVADVEWTFPLNFVEVIWGDGSRSDRQVIPATDLPPMSGHHFEIPFDATGRKWVRFSAWDSAGNGAMVQPVKLTP